MNLRTPGPIPLAEDVLEAMSWPMINHRGPEYADLLERTTGKLKQVFDTRGDMYIVTRIGHVRPWRRRIVNTAFAGTDRVLNLSIGAFGDRFGKIAEIFGAGRDHQTRLPFGDGRRPTTDSGRH